MKTIDQKEVARGGAEARGGSIQAVGLATVLRSATNPRKRFDEKALADLTESVRQHGVLQPILVRPLNGRFLVEDGKLNRKPVWFLLDRTKVRPGGGYDGIAESFKTLEAAEAARPRFELIAGERRLRAAQAAGLAEIPAIVRELSDQAALEIQVIENLQRADLHPLEEAEGYERLIQTHHYTVEDLAAKLGKSKAYVYARMKLTALCHEAREALWSDRITHSVALLLARIPDPKLQADALKEVVFDYYGEVRTFHDISADIQGDYMTRLKDAPFNPRDADLVPEAGPCSTCPKRTGNQPELFADVQGADVCTDPTCYGRKREAHAAQVVATAKEQGHEVITGPEAEKLFRYGSLQTGSKYVDVKDRVDVCGYDFKKTWSGALKKHLPAPVVVVDPKGEVHHLVARDQAIAAAKAAGLPVAAAEELPQSAKDRKAVIEENRLARAVTAKVASAIQDRVQDMKEELFWPFIFEVVLERWKTMKRIGEALGLDGDGPVGVEDEGHPLADALVGMAPVERRRLLMDAWLNPDGKEPYPGEVEVVAGMLKIDQEAIAKMVKVERARPASPTVATPGRGLGRKGKAAAVARGVGGRDEDVSG